MWISCCDACKTTGCVFGRNKDEQVWVMGTQSIQDKEVHACSKECAIRLDTRQGKE